MTKKESKIFDDFMGKEIESITSYPEEPHEWCHSWEWLMPVVEKLEEVGYFFIIAKNQINVFYKDFGDNKLLLFVEVKNKNKKEAVWTACKNTIIFNYSNKENEK